MSCSQCGESYDAEQRRPKALPCGHSLCVLCVQGLNKVECPVDHRMFLANVDTLPDNHAVLEMAQMEKKQVTRRFWCNDCNGVATEECLDEHSVSSLKRVRSQRAQAPLAELRAGEEALAGLRAELDSAASGLGAEVAASRGVLEDGLRGLDLMRQCLQDAIEADEAVFVEASRPTGLDGLAREASCLLPILGDAASEISLVLLGANATAWTASLRPHQRSAARLLLCQLLCAGELRRQGQADDQPAAGEAPAIAGTTTGLKLKRPREVSPPRTDPAPPPMPSAATVAVPGAVIIAAAATSGATSAASSTATSTNTATSGSTTTSSPAAATTSAAAASGPPPAIPLPVSVKTVSSSSRRLEKPSVALADSETPAKLRAVAVVTPAPNPTPTPTPVPPPHPLTAMTARPSPLWQEVANVSTLDSNSSETATKQVGVDSPPEMPSLLSIPLPPPRRLSPRRLSAPLPAAAAAAGLPKENATLPEVKTYTKRKAVGSPPPVPLPVPHPSTTAAPTSRWHDGPKANTTTLDSSIGGPASKWRAIGSATGSPKPQATVTTTTTTTSSSRGCSRSKKSDYTEAAVSWVEKSNAFYPDSETMAKRMVVGSRVRRGLHWPCGSTMDGTPPGPGTVVAEEDNDRVTVQWDSGGRCTYTMGVLKETWYAKHSPEQATLTYKFRYELALLPSAEVYKTVCGVSNDSPEYLNVSTSCVDAQKREELLTNGQLDKVRVLMDLNCEVAPSWSKRVLQRVASRLEALRLEAPDATHLRVVKNMPALQELFLSSVDKETLELALSMSGLVGLEAHCHFEKQLSGLKVPPKASLTWLCLGIYPLRAALAVIRAHAATLETLELVAASFEPYGCPDLAAQLKRCELKALRNLELRRESSVHFCRHEVPSCKLQVQQLADMFADCGLAVHVQCFVCDSS